MTLGELRYASNFDEVQVVKDIIDYLDYDIEHRDPMKSNRREKKASSIPKELQLNMNVSKMKSTHGLPSLNNNMDAPPA